MFLGSLVLSGWQFFIAGVVIFVGVIAKLGITHQDNPDLMLAREPFRNLFTYNTMLVMAIALMLVGAMTAGMK
jgi:hypothetical protein